MNKAPMMGKATFRRYYHLYCCPGHDGPWRSRIRLERTAQRIREKRQWNKENYE